MVAGVSIQFQFRLHFVVLVVVLFSVRLWINRHFIRKLILLDFFSICYCIKTHFKCNFASNKMQQNFLLTITKLHLPVRCQSRFYWHSTAFNNNKKRTTRHLDNDFSTRNLFTSLDDDWSRQKKIKIKNKFSSFV